MPSIRVESLEFGTHKFRKLTNIKIPISPRLTVVAGHNGIGKSTILALLAHPSGLTTSAQISYFDKTYQANFNEIIHIDYHGDYASKLGPPKILSEPAVSYLINNNEALVKACRLGPRGKNQQARVVARTIKPSTSKFQSADGSVTVGAAGKVPLPTIYLGMTRVLPVGEATPGNASSSAQAMHADDAELISQFMNAVISGSNTSPAAITTQKIKYTGKMSSQPQHAFDPRCVSLGQDSLGSIALALASFQKLKREWPEYPGGLLIVDEIDAGLHPHAIGALTKSLKSFARSLRLQIIATTHSPKLIEAVHPESEPNNPNPIDSIVYIRDTANPKKMEAPSLKQIFNDMSLTPPLPETKKSLPKLKIYFEDDEAAAVFRALIPPKRLQAIGKSHSVKLEPLPLGVGCENLARLADHDPYFKEVLIILDADATVNKNNGKNKHIVKLPGDMYSAALIGNENQDIVGRPLAPERTLLQYILNIVNSPELHGATLERLDKKDVTTDQLRVNMLDGATTVLSRREQTKSWWKEKFPLIEGWQLLEEWATDRPAEIAQFLAEFDAAVAAVAPLAK
ncbi:AAA family ATPase [Variovorax sp. DAIF25]|uniref:AAA family ATPase n=1 Tax=Variovorax sp. DAIF25 TaxID=3080983 RepID=UPI003D6C0DA5